jgi:(p)ppGpp synthase/HD superfamily hydrolase
MSISQRILTQKLSHFTKCAKPQMGQNIFTKYKSQGIKIHSLTPQLFERSHQLQHLSAGFQLEHEHDPQ